MTAIRVLMALVLAAGSVCAQQAAPAAQPTPQPEMSADEMARLGLPPILPTTPVDESELSEEERARLEEFRANALGSDATWEEFVAKFLEPRPFPSESVRKIDDRYANPHPGMSGWKMEIVKEEGDTIWLRGLPPENPESMLHKLWLMRQDAELLTMLRKPVWDAAYFLDFKAEIVPPASVDSLELQEVDAGLPSEGRWQMNFAATDMNDDGVTDLVFPPSRLGPAYPVIFLGNGDGTFEIWREVRWTAEVPWDYGGVAVADFDGDGDKDLVFGIHFKAQYVVYNDGEGQFPEAVMLPRPDQRFSSRTPAVADFNGDGRLDVAFQSEINYDQGTREPSSASPTVWVVHNTGDRTWEVRGESGRWEDVGLPNLVIGDSLSAEDVDGDGRPDLVLSSNMTGFRSLVYLNRGPEEAWQKVEHVGVLSNGFHYDSLLLPNPPGDTPQVFAAYNQFLLVGGENQVRTGIIRYPFEQTEEATGLLSEGTPLVVSDQAANPYFRLAAGDLNGDGLTDLVAGRKLGPLELWIQVAENEFYLERSPEVQPAGGPYHIELLDLDGDGLDDIVVGAATRQDLPGGVKVWLTRTRG